MSMHNYVAALNAEERHRDLVARAEASRLARAARRQRRARAWRWRRRGRRPVAQPGPVEVPGPVAQPGPVEVPGPVAQPGPVEVPPQRVPADAAVGRDREAVLTPGPAANSGYPPG